MKTLTLTAAVIAAFLVAGCDQQEVYPISGQECGPNDPVQTISVPNCIAPA